jgi:hypothetical protein
VEDDLIRNIRLIERLKCGILQWVARLFQALYDSPEKSIQEALSHIIVYCYLLANRVGISFSRLDQGINEKARVFLQEKDMQERGIPHDDLLKFLRYREGLKK